MLTEKMYDSDKIDSRGTVTDQASGLCSPVRGKRTLAASRVTAQRTPSAGLTLAFFEVSAQYYASQKSRLSYFIPDRGKMVRYSHLGTGGPKKDKGKNKLPATSFQVQQEEALFPEFTQISHHLVLRFQTVP